MLVAFASVLCAVPVRAGWVPLICVDVIDLYSVCCAYLSGAGVIDCVWVNVGGI